ncbi:sn-glycerol-3-phosphate ABC transporter ATP-binding protein UgpC [Pasteurella atlantica]|uniref:ABC transporter ATP-binding protein n=1 Tax=Phocoenobacter atlanticus TaxID=3416742 RepID=UPI00275AC563|nr:sn-glycerol-3-phosphate ABC transporter ATP-binding protein UgpC [Pasteurella atlantica]MDP8034453.1 sn-glycerol-3-phosphate ABC transporter ATP-binding protein UgpC [Pasteurella atlantica]MDP8036384.1 sn-glycerol-3-phosphate ABC transporter ATP-binding protein UgpC [Pasteurella atlantica]MDP8038347.1 sn-glycerol-3-phosphate ABC transporter ATP-binding protein UgpC [Pasteurella atlantica]MDP8048719.1 sn-glycerol-3-phosphate ABC transporter ATP-binding protein UgpC [Pasteurella atlantica]MDP
MADLKLKNINKIYPNGVQVVFDFNLEIKDKEFIAFVGPSGCGKSTTLRMIAGLEDISSGDLEIDGIIMNDVEPKDRDIAMVFQNYALYPHMTVYNNMAFALKQKKIPKEQIAEKVQLVAEILGLEDYLHRKPKALSGGQRQRVALGRAIVRNPKVFLMDEPLSNLDAKLRIQTRSELIKLHKQLATTTIYVTHDQVEAMTMATRIVVMKDGCIMQVGKPKEIYDNPENVFVGGFIGTPPMNFINGIVDAKGFFNFVGNKIKIPANKMELVKTNNLVGKEIILGIRPEDIHSDPLFLREYKDSCIDLTIELSELLGAKTHVYSTIGNNKISAVLDALYEISTGEQITLAFNVDKIHFFDVESEKVLKCTQNDNEKSQANKVKKSFFQHFLLFKKGE